MKKFVSKIFQIFNSWNSQTSTPPIPRGQLRFPSHQSVRPCGAEHEPHSAVWPQTELLTDEGTE